MDNKQTPPMNGLELGDIYYTLFRHKWKIILISLAATAGALGIYFFAPVPYQSEAKLLIRYMVESRPPGPPSDNESRVKSPDERGANIVNSELEILTSLDLALEVVTNLTPGTILATSGGGTNKYLAAAMIQKGLEAEVPKNSDVIRVAFHHRDGGLVNPVLTQLVDAYLRKSEMVHRSSGLFVDFIEKRTSDLRNELHATEDELGRAKTNAGVISVDDSRKLYTDQISRIQTALVDARAELAEHQATAAELARALQAKPAAATNQTLAPTNQTLDLPAQTAATAQGGATNSPPSTNAIAAVNEAPVPPDKASEYRRILGVLDFLGKRQQDLLAQFTPENVLLKNNQEQIAMNEKAKQQYEADYPGLLAVKGPEARPAATSTVVDLSPRERMEITLATETARVSALASKIKVLDEQLENVVSRARALYAAEGHITELQRKRDLEETQYIYFERTKEQNKTDTYLGAAKDANINEIQAPSEAIQNKKKVMKIAAVGWFFGIALAFGLPFVIDLFLDPSIKRPIEIETRLKLPLFLAIPRLKLNGHVPGLLSDRPMHLLAERAEAGGEESDVDGDHSAPPATGDEQFEGANEETEGQADFTSESLDASGMSPLLRPFNEALRDRLIAWFEARNLTHKPKLVAVTSCAEGAGVSTIAAGLAASLSETGDGNVLLVEMNDSGSVHEFFKGELACGLNEALEIDRRDSALVRDRLYAVTYGSNGDRIPRAIPKLFNHLVPRLRASDYDYIIFDMPPVSQISVTPRLARFMDMVLVVAESEKTDRDVVKRACAMLKETQPSFGIVLNKSRDYVPRRLLQEL